MKPNADPLLEKGRELLEAAKEEHSRSSEDVVTYLVCHNTRTAISHFLSSFLNSKDRLPPGGPAIDFLLSECAKLDARFGEVDLTPVLCRCDPVKANDCFCSDAAKASFCLQIGEQLQQMVAAQMPAY